MNKKEIFDFNIELFPDKTLRFYKETFDVEPVIRQKEEKRKMILDQYDILFISILWLWLMYKLDKLSNKLDGIVEDMRQEKIKFKVTKSL